jgi:DNA polymerase-1
MKFPRLPDFDLVALDTETTGLKWWQHQIFGVSISAGERDYYWDVRREPKVLDWLRDEVPHVRRLCAHNAKYDWHFCRERGIFFPEDRTICTMIRAALIDEHRLTYDLDSLGKDCVGIGKDERIWQELADMFGGKPTKHAQIDNLRRAPVELAGRYAKRDTRTCINLARWQDTKIAEQELGRVHALEMELLPVIVRMEQGGVRVDVDRAERAVHDIDRRAVTLQRELDELAGFPVNPNPSGSIHRLFQPVKVTGPDGSEYWQACDGTPLEATDAGKPSLDADALRTIKHPAAGKILTLRKLLKARDTFLKGHVLSNHDDGVIHANINQTKSEGDVGTGTGRLSINDPALQQIPKRDKDMAAIVRAVFIPDDEESDWVCNDWAQMDFRVFSHYVNDQHILEMYDRDPDTDFHTLAAGLTGLPRSPRFAGDPNAKQINLGLVFGMGKGKLAQEMGLPYTVEPNGRGGTWLKPGPEAEDVFTRYHSAIPGVGDLLRDASAVAKARGFVKTAMGRRIRFPRGQFTHKAGGLIFQGTAADCLKVKLVELDAYLRSEADSGARLLLNVHDEFDHSIPKGRQDIRDEINRIVTRFGPGDRIPLRVPVRTDQGIGPDWWEASK